MTIRKMADVTKNIGIGLESCPVLSRSIELNMIIAMILDIDFIHDISWKCQVLHMPDILKIKQHLIRKKYPMVPICSPENPEYSGKCYVCTLLSQLHTFDFFSNLFFFIAVHLSTPFVQSNHSMPKTINFNFYSEEETVSFVCLYIFCTKKVVIK